jgi:predicted RNase H-like nuclease (RuvC/YqgF family)
LNTKLEQDLRSLKKFHDEQFEQHIQSTAATVDQLHTEIRSLKRLCDEKTEEVSPLNHEIKELHSRVELPFIRHPLIALNLSLAS